MHGGASTLASRLRLAMTLRKVTIHGLAECAGYGPSTVTLYRRDYGYYHYRLNVVFDLAQALSIRPCWLAFGEGEME